MTMSLNLNPDFREFLQLLADNQVEHRIVGGYAVAANGHPRYTKDIDVWIRPTFDNAARLVAALDEFGFGSLGIKASDFLEPDTVVQLGYPPRRIDLLTTPSGVTFEECYDQRVTIVADGTELHIIGLAHLRANKLAFGATSGPGGLGCAQVEAALERTA